MTDEYTKKKGWLVKETFMNRWFASAHEKVFFGGE